MTSPVMAVPPDETVYHLYSPLVAPVAPRVMDVPEHPLLLVVPGGEGIVQTMKFVALLTVLQPIVTPMSPVVAPAGTVTSNVVDVEELMVAVIPLKVTLLVNGEAKLVPTIVTDAPTAPEGGEKEVMVGAEIVLMRFLKICMDCEVDRISFLPSPSISAFMMIDEVARGIITGVLKEDALIRPEVLTFL